MHWVAQLKLGADFSMKKMRSLAEFVGQGTANVAVFYCATRQGNLRPNQGGIKF